MGKATTTSLKDFGLSRPGIEPTTSRSRGGPFSKKKIFISSGIIGQYGNSVRIDPYRAIVKLTHYQTTNLRLFQTERVCRRQFQIRRKWQQDIQTGRKHCGKRRNCSLRAISPFLTVFSKGLFSMGVKMCHCVGMG